jgi:hypothetical protein
VVLLHTSFNIVTIRTWIGDVESLNSINDLSVFLTHFLTDGFHLIDDLHKGTGPVRWKLLTTTLQYIQEVTIEPCIVGETGDEQEREEGSE